MWVRAAACVPWRQPQPLPTCMAACRHTRCCCRHNKPAWPHPNPVCPCCLQVAGNPCLAYAQHIVLPWCEKFEVERKEENGGNK